jgi:hypothetical protein
MDAPHIQSHAQTSTSGQPKKSRKFWRVGKAVKAVSRLFGMSVHATLIIDSQGVVYTLCQFLCILYVFIPLA